MEERVKKGKAIVWFVCFALLLLLPRAIWIAAGDRFETDATENAATVQFPKLTRENYREFAAQFEGAYNNGVPFRSQLISFNSLLDVKVFGEKEINDKVVIGDEDWLFYSAESDIDDFKGSNLFSEEELSAIADNLMTSKEWVEDRGIEFVLFIAPNKETIYGEDYLPSYYKRGEQTRVRQLVEYLRENTDLREVYPEEEMKEYKDDWSLY